QSQAIHKYYPDPSSKQTSRRTRLAQLLLHGLAKFQWVRDAMERFPRASGADDRNGAISKQPSNKALVHAHGFNALQIELQRVAVDQPLFHDHALASDRKLAGPILDQRQQPQREESPQGKIGDPVTPGLEDDLFTGDQIAANVAHEVG